jgi:hypothetical protein
MKKNLTDKDKEEFLRKIDDCDNLKSLLGYDFLKKAIQDFQYIDNKWSSKNICFVNYLHVHFDKEDYFLSLEMMLSFYLKNFPEYIKSTDVINRLTSRRMEDFQGKWSEIALGYYLHGKGVKILEMSPKDKTYAGENEICDIKTDLGCFEVSAILSEARTIFPEDSVFWGDTNVSYSDTQLVNKKISRKQAKKILALDCSWLDNVRLQFNNIRLGFDINFDVFKKTSKKIMLFVRDTTTEQVVCHRIVTPTA